MEMAMGLFVLSHIFRGVDDLVSLEDDEPSRTTKGPIWMVQVWLTAYFPKLFNWRSSMPKEPIPVMENILTWLSPLKPPY